MQRKGPSQGRGKPRPRLRGSRCSQEGTSTTGIQSAGDTSQKVLQMRGTRAGATRAVLAEEGQVRSVPVGGREDTHPRSSRRGGHAAALGQKQRWRCVWVLGTSAPPPRGSASRSLRDPRCVPCLQGGWRGRGALAPLASAGARQEPRGPFTKARVGGLEPLWPVAGPPGLEGLLLARVQEAALPSLRLRAQPLAHPKPEPAPRASCPPDSSLICSVCSSSPCWWARPCLAAFQPSRKPRRADQ